MDIYQLFPPLVLDNSALFNSALFQCFMLYFRMMCLRVLSLLLYARLTNWEAKVYGNK